MFRSPRIVACILPGGYRYLHIRKPGKMLPRSIAIRFDFYVSPRQDDISDIRAMKKVFFANLGQSADDRLLHVRNRLLPDAIEPLRLGRDHHLFQQKSTLHRVQVSSIFYIHLDKKNFAFHVGLRSVPYDRVVRETRNDVERVENAIPSKSLPINFPLNSHLCYTYAIHKLIVSELADL